MSRFYKPAFAGERIANLIPAAVLLKLMQIKCRQVK